MKVLYALAGVAIIVVLLLAPVALFPETVLDLVDDIRTRYVERHRYVTELKQSVEAAENGDRDHQYLIASYHLYEGRWWRHEIYEDVLGPQDREKGRAMMRELVASGHPRALYNLSDGIDVDVETWKRALYAGSFQAVRELHGRFVKHPCDDTLYGYVNFMRPRLDDPAYPRRPSYLPEYEREYREREKAILIKDVAVLDSLRAETCVTD